MKRPTVVNKHTGYDYWKLIPLVLNRDIQISLCQYLDRWYYGRHIATYWIYRISGPLSSTRKDVSQVVAFNTLRPRQNGRHFADDIFECIFLNENVWISLEISLKFVHDVRINNIPVLVQIMAWRRPGDKPLSESMMVSLLTHICVTRPQWINDFKPW